MIEKAGEDWDDCERTKGVPTNLVIALAGSAVSNVLAALKVGATNDVLGDNRASQRSAQQVARLVDGVALDGREYEVRDELLAHVNTADLHGTVTHCLSLNRLEVIGLTNIGDVAHALVSLILQPPERASGEQRNLRNGGL